MADLNIRREGDGFLVIAAMRSAQPQCKNFILTGYPGLENAIRAIQNQVDDYFAKPADIEELVSKIKARLAGPVARPTRLAAVLMEHEREITGIILEAIKRDVVTAKARLNDQERVDHLPSIFEAVIAQLMYEGRALRRAICDSPPSWQAAQERRLYARHADARTPTDRRDHLRSARQRYPAVRRGGTHVGFEIVDPELERAHARLFSRILAREVDSAFPHDTMGEIPAAILCIDDEEPALMLRRRVLEKAGYRVLPR